MVKLVEYNIFYYYKWISKASAISSLISQLDGSAIVDKEIDYLQLGKTYEPNIKSALLKSVIAEDIDVITLLANENTFGDTYVYYNNWFYKNVTDIMHSQNNDSWNKYRTTMEYRLVPNIDSLYKLIISEGYTFTIKQYDNLKKFLRNNSLIYIQ